MMQDKKVILIDEHGQPLGEADLLAAHRHPAQYHLAVSVWLIRDHQGRRQVLLQKRSLEKIVGANQWGNGICGNVRPGEGELGCAKRRLREEIGVSDVELAPLYRFKYQVFSNDQFGEHELDQVFLGKYDGQFDLNPAEVQAVIWVDLAELESQLQNCQIVKPEQTLIGSTGELEKITPALWLNLAGQTLEISPWTAIMLGDSRLRTALHQTA